MSGTTGISATYTPPRKPKQITIAMTATAIDLGGASGNAQRSVDGFKLQCSAAWSWGDVDGQAHTVAANATIHFPSSSLSGWYAKTATGSSNLIATALLDVSGDAT